MSYQQSRKLAIQVSVFVFYVGHLKSLHFTHNFKFNLPHLAFSPLWFSTGEQINMNLINCLLLLHRPDDILRQFMVVIVTVNLQLIIIKENNMNIERFPTLCQKSPQSNQAVLIDKVIGLLVNPSKVNKLFL